ncbi:MAG: NAD(P)H-hydrate dehydratase [Acidobacteria bacterium]|nr:NAD(P)H-hydrate dehydratase [Acidobacteriota bacterium]
MQRAATALAQHSIGVIRARCRLYGAHVLLLVGSGNNGGDALLAGVALINRGARVTAVSTSARIHPEAATAFRRAGGSMLRWENGHGDHSAANQAVVALALEADVIIDGLLGTGSQGALREPAASLVAALARAPLAAWVIACDIPSGLDPDSGQANQPVLMADSTVTFGAAKRGLYVGAGPEYAGTVVVAEIGLGSALEQVGPPDVYQLTAAGVAHSFPVPARSAQKYSRGVLGVVAGSEQYPGAALLTTSAAVQTGVGMVRYLGPDAISRLINARTPEAVCADTSVAENHVQAWLVGPGTGEDEATTLRMRDALASGLPVVTDAGALALLPERVGPQVILTPHAGELSQLLQQRGIDAHRRQVEADPLHWARLAAEQTGATVLLKGPCTVITSPDGLAFAQSDGTPWLATAGSGDVLAGVLGALAANLANDVELATRLDLPAEARWTVMAALAASLHGRAGVLASGGGPLRATAIAAAIPDVVAALRK